jgi:hypothetical protein
MEHQVVSVGTKPPVPPDFLITKVRRPCHTRKLVTVPAEYSELQVKHSVANFSGSDDIRSGPASIQLEPNSWAIVV